MLEKNFANNFLPKDFAEKICGKILPTTKIRLSQKFTNEHSAQENLPLYIVYIHIYRAYIRLLIMNDMVTNLFSIAFFCHDFRVNAKLLPGTDYGHSWSVQTVQACACVGAFFGKPHKKMPFLKIK